MKIVPFVALAVWACAASAHAEFLSDSPHALGGSRLYVGGLSYNPPSSLYVFIELELTMGGPPFDPPAPGAAPRSGRLDGVVILSSSIPGGGAAGSPYPFSMSFTDVFSELGPGGATAFYDTEMLSLSIEGVDPVLGRFMIRESPTLPSLGRYSVELLSTGQYRIDSFFDVFTELSVDGGQSWTPSDGSSRLRLVPEPATFTLLVMGGLSLVIFWRRKFA